MFSLCKSRKCSEIFFAEVRECFTQIKMALWGCSAVGECELKVLLYYFRYYYSPMVILLRNVISLRHTRIVHTAHQCSPARWSEDTGMVLDSRHSDKVQSGVQ